MHNKLKMLQKIQRKGCFKLLKSLITST